MLFCFHLLHNYITQTLSLIFFLERNNKYSFLFLVLIMIRSMVRNTRAQIFQQYLHSLKWCVLLHISKKSNKIIFRYTLSEVFKHVLMKVWVLIIIDNFCTTQKITLFIGIFYVIIFKLTIDFQWWSHYISILEIQWYFTNIFH